jgi:hypothetical protein
MRSNQFPPLAKFASLLVALGLFLGQAPALAGLPVTGDRDGGAAAVAVATPGLIPFTQQVANGAAGQVTGLQVDGLFAYPVVQQPAGQPAYVSTAADTVTQFGTAASFGSLGFLAHNNLAGARFAHLEHGDLVAVVYGDGHYVLYQVKNIRRLQALQPTNPYSAFLDLVTGEQFTAEALFYQTYGVAGTLVLQTCIASEGSDSWGRLFILAEPLPPEPPGKQSNG